MTRNEIREYFITEKRDSIFVKVIVKDIEKDIVYEKEIVNPEYINWLEQKFVDLVTP
jgi:hypothetical protein